MAKAPDVAWARPRRSILPKVLVGLVLLAIFWQVGVSRRPAAQLRPDCTTPAFKLASDSVQEGHLLVYTMVGPTGRWYALGIDTRTMSPDGQGGWNAVPLPGHTEYEVAASVKSLKGCRHTALFGVPFFPVGPHTVTMYDLSGAVAVEIAHTTIQVTAD